MHWSCVRVPASSANLGPGFDALGVALGIYLECRFRRSDTLAIQVQGAIARQISTGRRQPDLADGAGGGGKRAHADAPH